MKKKNDYTKEIPFIRRRCPHLKDQALLDAEKRFRQHLLLCMELEEYLYNKKKNQKQIQAVDDNEKRP